MCATNGIINEPTNNNDNDLANTNEDKIEEMEMQRKKFNDEQERNQLLQQRANE